MSLDTIALLSDLRGLLPAPAKMTADSPRVGRGDVFLAFPGTSTMAASTSPTQ